MSDPRDSDSLTVCLTKGGNPNSCLFVQPLKLSDILRRTLVQIENDNPLDPESVAQLKRIVLQRIAVLELNHALEAKAVTSEENVA